MELKYMQEEVEKRAYDDTRDDIFLGEFLLYELSINLIDLPLTYIKLINWDEPTVLHIDKFPSEVTLLRYTKAEILYKKVRLP